MEVCLLLVKMEELIDGQSWKSWQEGINEEGRHEAVC